MNTDLNEKKNGARWGLYMIIGLTYMTLPRRFGSTPICMTGVGFLSHIF